jgi:uncharacterized protein (DUF305 family)
MRPYARRTALAAVVAASALALTACGNSGTDGAASSGSSSAPSPSMSMSMSMAPHNAADVSFAQQMIQHHQQAITMAGMAAEKASSAEVKALADKIEKAQAPEITTMSGWLKMWGEDVPSAGMSDGMSDMPSMSSMPGMDHGSMSSSSSSSSAMPGMMSDADMTALGKKSGKAFDTAFLTMMVQHHEGAVEMARTEQSGGSYAPAKKLAGSVITSQTAEIAQMKKMLGTS